MTSVKKHIVIGSLCAIVGIILASFPVGEILELKSYDLFHFFKKPAVPPDDIVIVAIDEPSFAEIRKQWPWPRSLHAKLIDALKIEGASIIGFDITFFEPTQPDEDAAFSRAMRRAGNVCLASEIEKIDRKNFTQQILVEPIPVLRDNSFTGVVNILLDEDAVVRKFYPVEEHEILFSKQIARLHVKREFEIGKNSYISYIGPPGSFNTVSYYQALEPSLFLPRGFFKNKIVVIGRQLKTSPEPTNIYPDIFATPFLFSRKTSMMSGVEIQANMVYNFLTGDFVTRLSRFVRILLFFIIGIAGSFLQMRWKPLRSCIISVLFVIAYFVFAYFLFLRHRIWIPTVMAVLPVFLSYVTHGATTYIQTEKKRRELGRAFSHYLSPAVLNMVLERPEKLKLGGEKVEATILFSDIVDFTRISEKIPPEDVSLLLNRFFDDMTKIIFKFKGTVDKFIGDAVMVFWGAPLTDPEHALNACRTAIAMQDRLKSLRDEMKRDGLPEINIRIGINTGEVIAGNMGSSKLFNYTVLGDAVNLAARLETANKEMCTSIIISKSVYEKAAESIKARPLGSIHVKGKAEPVEIYELLDAEMDNGKL